MARIIASRARAEPPVRGQTAIHDKSIEAFIKNAEKIIMMGVQIRAIAGPGTRAGKNGFCLA
jgi:hypothetical protein